MSRTVYWVNGSIPSYSVLLALAEKGLAFDGVRLRVMGRRETREPAFLEINRRGKAPVLVEADGVVVTESLAILHYLERVYPTPPLLPDSSTEVAVVLSRMHSVEYLRAAYRPLEALFLTSLTDAQRASVKAAPAAVQAELKTWEAFAETSTFIAGQQLTLADCLFFAALTYQVRRGLSLEGFPHLRAYRARVGARDSARRALPIGWEHPPKRSLFAEAAGLA